MCKSSFSCSLFCYYLFVTTFNYFNRYQRLLQRSLSKERERIDLSVFKRNVRYITFQRIKVQTEPFEIVQKRLYSNKSTNKC